MILLLVLALFGSGCASRQKRASDAYVICVRDAMHKPGLTPRERNSLANGCDDLYRMRTGR